MSFPRLILLGLLVAGVWQNCLAAPIDDARREVEDAQRNYDRALSSIDSARNAVDRNIADHRQFQQDLSEASSQYTAIQQQLSGLEKTAKADRDTAQKIKADQDTAAKLITDQKKITVQNDRVVDNARNDALQNFQKDPATLELQTKIDESNTILQSQTERVDIELRKTEPYGKLRKEADTAEAAIKQLRQSPNTDPQTLAIASQNWMTTRNKAETELNQACKKDAKYIEAIEAQSLAKKTLVDTTNDFKKSLNDKPEIVILIQAADQSKADLLRAEQAKRKIDANLKDAQSAASKSMAKYNNTFAQSDSLKASRDRAAIDLKQNELDRPNLENDSRRAEIDLREANIRLQRAKQNLADQMKRAN